MTMLHLTYPKRKGFFSWEELGCFARALGFPSDVFVSNIPEDVLTAEPGLTVKMFNKMIDYKYFNESFERTFNLHSAEWNLCCIRKSMRLLLYKVLSFEQLQNVRVSYQVYEAGDMKGMVTEPHTLLRALKMCGRTIAPMKLAHRIKHMSEDFEENGRIQLYEFFDLILWCDTLESMQLEPIELVEGRENRDSSIYKLNDFEAVIQHYDARLSNYLNSVYLKDEWDFGTENLGSKKVPREPPIDSDVRRNQVTRAKKKYKPLKLHIGQSQERVYHAKAGYVRPRPISAPEAVSLDQVELSERESVVSTRAQSVMELAHKLIRPAVHHKHRDIREEVPRPEIKPYVRPASPTAVRNTDIKQAEYDMDTLKFEMETLELKYQKLLNADLDCLLPGYRDRKAREVPPELPPAPPEPKPKKLPRPTPAFINKLAYSQYRPPPPPSHAKACDARHRGWHKVKTKPGRHVVIASPTFSSSPSTKMFEKMNKQSMRPVKHVHGDNLKRYTPRSKVVEEVVRPNTAPEDQPNLMSDSNDCLPVYSYEVESTKLSQVDSFQAMESASQRPESGSQVPLSASSSRSLVSWGDLQLYADDEEVMKVSRRQKSKTNISKDNGPEKCAAENESVSKNSVSKVEMTKAGKVTLLEDIMEMATEREEAEKNGVDENIQRRSQNTQQGRKQSFSGKEKKFVDWLESDGASVCESSDERSVKNEKSYMDFFHISDEQLEMKRNKMKVGINKKRKRLLNRAKGMLSEPLLNMINRGIGIQ